MGTGAIREFSLDTVNAVAGGAGDPDAAVADGFGRALIAGVAALLQRYTDRSTVAVGYLANGSAQPVTVTLDLGDDPSFKELLDRVSAAGADDASPGELDAMVALDRDPPADEHHPIWLNATDDAGQPRVAMHPNGELGAAGSADRVLGHLQTMLDEAAANPEQPVGALSVLTDPERHQLLVEWNATAAPYPARCLHELVRDQAGRTPDKIAVECGGESLTYAELDARASQLANHLLELGVGADVLVGICVERSVEMLVGLLGILRAGGAYVPIDPAYPVERQEFMLTNSETRVVVTQERLVANLPVEGLHVVCLDRDWPVIARASDQPPALDYSPEQLAYVIYTSGSTGKPKGVQIPHRALVNFLETMRDKPGLGADDVLVAVTTLSFDIAGLELYLPLIVGARVVIAEAQTAGDPRALAELLARSAATAMQATPTTWRMLLDSGWPGNPGLKALCGGEALPVALADGLADAVLELWNMYGPTETTIWSTVEHITTKGESLTIGRPIANTKLYILDGRMQPVPVGVAGELWIGGDGLARGYRGRPDLTEERFVPDPFDGRPEARMYRTGDLARYRSDGRVDFLGRIDHQVKVRGFRIELGEIETVLTRHKAVAGAVVVARGSAGDAELAAYYLPRGVPVGANALRRYLMQKLPAYMVPSTVTALESFPLTPNGKVDRKALPEPTRERSDETELIAPRTPLEQRLAGIWERELGIHPIGVTDNFFDLGVTSFVAATLFAAIEHELGNALPLGAIFRAPTIESLAALIEQDSGASRWTSLIPIQPEGTKPPIFCVHGGAGTILHLAPLARHLGTDQPFYGLQSRGLYGRATPLHTVEEMATHYLSEMRQVHPEGPWCVAGYCFGTIVAFELAQRLRSEGEDVRLVAMFNGPSPSWIKQWKWYGNQPSWRARNANNRTADEPADEPIVHRLTFAQRLRRAVREPRRFYTGAKWQFRRPLMRIGLKLGRPVPENLREEYFFELHAKAERAYEPVPYPGELVVFYGQELYEDPTLGWEGLGTVISHAVPGQHDNNRQAMMEPAVGFVAERLQAYLDGNR